MRFSRPLQDVVAMEKDKVTLECELSRPNVDVHWLKVPPTPRMPLLPSASHLGRQGWDLTMGNPGPDPDSFLLRMVWS